MQRENTTKEEKLSLLNYIINEGMFSVGTVEAIKATIEQPVKWYGFADLPKIPKGFTEIHIMVKDDTDHATGIQYWNYTKGNFYDINGNKHSQHDMQWHGTLQWTYTSNLCLDD